jgi:trans-aconitate methyltransferase
MPALTLNRAAGDVECPASANETADYLQAEYFLRLLSQSRRHIDHRIGEYHKAIAAAQAAGDTEGAATLRRMEHTEEQDRQTLEGLIQNLRRRFPVRAPGEVPQVPRGAARLAVR